MGKLTTSDSHQQRAYGLIHGSSPEYHIGGVLKRNEELQAENVELKEVVKRLKVRIEELNDTILECIEDNAGADV